MPGVSPSISSSEMPPAPSPPVRTAVVKKSARIPDVMNVFSPVTTKWSPSRVATVRNAETSEPPEGSVMASAAIRSPASTGGSTRAFSSGLPNSETSGPPIVCDISEATTPPEPHWASSTLAISR